MKNKIEISVGAIVIAVAIVLVLLFTHKASVNLGSVSVGSSYYSTTTASGWANLPIAVATSGSTALRSGTLGSIVIGTTDARAIEIKDATSSTDIASTTILLIAASPAIGSTMTFDVAFKRGLMVNAPTSFVGSYAITYRNE